MRTIRLLTAGGTPFDAMHRYGPMWVRVTRVSFNTGPWPTATKRVETYNITRRAAARVPFYSSLYKRGWSRLKLGYFRKIAISLGQVCNPRMEYRGMIRTTARKASALSSRFCSRLYIRFFFFGRRGDRASWFFM